MGAFKDAHGGQLRNLYLDADAAEAAKRGSRRPQVLGPDRAPALRPRAADERRLLAARRLPGPGRLRGRPGRHAPRQRHPLADPDHARRDPGLRRAARARRDHRPARPRGRAQRHHDRRPTAGSPTSGAEALAVFGSDDRAHPAVRYLHRPCRQRLSRRPGAGHRGADALRFQASARHAAGAARPVPEAGLAPRDRLPDPQPDAPRAPGADLPRRPGGRGQPPDPARGRHDQARRRRPLHPRALLREAAAATIPSRPRR